MKSFALVVAGVLVLALGSFVRAEEGGAGHYMPGAAASVVDALPGRSTLAVANFFTFYDASGGGSRQFAFGGVVAANVDATAYADTILGLYQTPFHLLGGDYTGEMDARARCREAARGRLRLVQARLRALNDGTGDEIHRPANMGRVHSSPSSTE